MPRSRSRSFHGSRTGNVAAAAHDPPTNVRFVPIADIATVLDMTRQTPTEEAFILTSINAARTLYIETYRSKCVDLVSSNKP